MRTFGVGRETFRRGASFPSLVDGTDRKLSVSCSVRSVLVEASFRHRKRARILLTVENLTGVLPPLPCSRDTRAHVCARKKAGVSFAPRARLLPTFVKACFVHKYIRSHVVNRMEDTQRRDTVSTNRHDECTAKNCFLRSRCLSRSTRS